MLRDNDEEPTADEREIIELVIALRETGNLRPLVAMLRGTDDGPERARDALRALGEYDLDLLAQIALDTLIDGYVDDPALAPAASPDDPRGRAGSLTA